MDIEKNKIRCKAYRESHKEQMANYKKRWEESHKEELKAKRKLYYEANKKRIIEKSIGWNKLNLDSHREACNKYAEKRRDKINADRRIYYSNHLKEERNRKNEHRNKKTCVNITCIFCGKSATVQKRASGKFCSAECANRWRSGENSYNWKGGLSFEPYCPKFNNDLKQRVRAFFEYRCVTCGKSEKELGYKLGTHHVEYDKAACCHGRPVTFAASCRRCHGRTNADRPRWEAMLHRCIDDIWGGRSYYTKEEYAEICKQHPEEDARQ